MGAPSASTVEVRALELAGDWASASLARRVGEGFSRSGRRLELRVTTLLVTVVALLFAEVSGGVRSLNLLVERVLVMFTLDTV